ncbi:hypothetical protein HJC23_010240 [Cyclotella cryptica]|uniref:Uncharacterized protein n=1 Tax=Cyclotella cryptica TaxID=29204 RepID=A0ABD3Q0E4_9STRA
MVLSKLAELIGLYDVLAPIRSDDNCKPEETDRVSTKRSRLDAQKKAEEVAASRGVFAKNQRVQYHNKLTNAVSDAVIIGVHLDDGPDDPYYTKRYKKQQEVVQDDGSPSVRIVEVEKQTNPDRLSRVEWNAEKSWELLQ